jgi:hypothetical protein
VRRLTNAPEQLLTTRGTTARADNSLAPPRKRSEIAAHVDDVEGRVWRDQTDDNSGRAPRIRDASDSELLTHRSLVDSVIAERGAKILRDVGLALPDALPQRDGPRTSPLDLALRRYRQAQQRPTTESATDTLVQPGVMPREAGHAYRDVAAPNGETVAKPVIAAQDVLVRRDPSTGESIAPSLESRERAWWSARVDAIHTRSESLVPLPPRAGAPRFEDDLPDESAFADTLAEVLHRQARAYGVAVP